MASTSERIYVVRSGTSATTSTLVALAPSTAKTVISVLGSANDTIGLKRVRVSFASVTATDIPATVEVGIISAAGTVGTAFTPVQTVGSSLPSSCAAGYNHSGEPTYNRIFETLYCPVYNGLADWYYPLGEEPQCDPSQGFAIRVTATQTQNCYASLWYSE
jgi:hypothetical protein